MHVTNRGNTIVMQWSTVWLTNHVALTWPRVAINPWVEVKPDVLSHFPQFLSHLFLIPLSLSIVPHSNPKRRKGKLTHREPPFPRHKPPPTTFKNPDSDEDSYVSSSSPSHILNQLPRKPKHIWISPKISRKNQENTHANTITQKRNYPKAKSPVLGLLVMSDPSLALLRLKSLLSICRYNEDCRCLEFVRLPQISQESVPFSSQFPSPPPLGFLALFYS